MISRSLFAAVVAAVGIGFAPHPAAAALSTGVVDVTTTLGYQNGSAAGTGIVLTSTGEILTNNHVIRGATDLRVIDPSTGRSYAATVVGYSVTRDHRGIAVEGRIASAHRHARQLGDGEGRAEGHGHR